MLSKIVFSLCVALTSGFITSPEVSADVIKIVATTSTFASLAKEVTGDLAEVDYVASPKRNVHTYSPTPKDVFKVKIADVFIHGGADLELWKSPLLEAAGNPAFLGEKNTVIHLSEGIQMLEAPQELTRSEGDIHRYGNPHYWLSPANVHIIVNHLAMRLGQLYPQHVDVFKRNASQFQSRLKKKEVIWQSELSPYVQQAIVTYHRTWSYFSNYFNFIVVAEIEPKPGIAPSAKHLIYLYEIMKSKDVKVIVKAPFYERRTPKKVADVTGATVVTLPLDVGGVKEATDFIALIDYNVSQLKRAFSKGVV